MKKPIVNNRLKQYNLNVNVSDPEISGLILRLAEHYTQNVATRFIRPLLVPVLSDTSLERRISDFTDETADAIDHGIAIEDLYLQINAITRFISDVRSIVFPKLSQSLDRSSNSANDSQNIYRNMAISNFRPNIDLLEQYTKELFEAVVRYDKSQSKEKPAYEKIPETVQTAHFLHVKMP